MAQFATGDPTQYPETFLVIDAPYVANTIGVSLKDFMQALKTEGYVYDSATQTWTLGAATPGLSALTEQDNQTAEYQRGALNYLYDVPSWYSSVLSSLMGGASPTGRTDQQNYTAKVGGMVWNTGR